MCLSFYFRSFMSSFSNFISTLPKCPITGTHRSMSTSLRESFFSSEYDCVSLLDQPRPSIVPTPPDTCAWKVTFLISSLCPLSGKSSSCLLISDVLSEASWWLPSGTSPVLIKNYLLPRTLTSFDSKSADWPSIYWNENWTTFQRQRWLHSDFLLCNTFIEKEKDSSLLAQTTAFNEIAEHFHKIRSQLFVPIIHWEEMHPSYSFLSYCYL